MKGEQTMPNQNHQTLRDRMLAVMADVNAQVAEREELVEDRKSVV